MGKFEPGLFTQGIKKILKSSFCNPELNLNTPRSLHDTFPHAGNLNYWLVCVVVLRQAVHHSEEGTANGEKQTH